MQITIFWLSVRGPIYLSKKYWNTHSPFKEHTHYTPWIGGEGGIRGCGAGFNYLSDLSKQMNRHYKYNVCIGKGSDQLFVTLCNMYIHYLSIPLYTISCPNTFRAHILSQECSAVVFFFAWKKNCFMGGGGVIQIFLYLDYQSLQFQTILSLNTIFH